MGNYNWNVYNQEYLVKKLCENFDELNFVDDVINRKKVVKGQGKFRYPLGYLIYLVRKIYTGYYQHKVFKETTSVSYKVLTNWFGRDYHKYTDILLEYTEVWSKSQGYTRGWKLKDDTRKVLDDYFTKEVRQKEVNRMLGLDGKVIKQLSDAGIYRVTDNIGRRMRKEEKLENNIHSIIEINFDNVQNCLDIIRQVMDSGYIKNGNLNKWTKGFLNKSPGELKDYRNVLREIRDISDTEWLPKGKMYQHYYETSTGRVYSTGHNSLQRMRKLIRNVILGGVGYWDYDIQNCHYTLLNHLVEYYGLKSCNSFDEYIKNKVKIRNNLSKDLGVELSVIKECIIAVMYGCSKVNRDGNKLTDLLGKQKQILLVENTFIKELFEDRNRVVKDIIDITDKENKKYNFLKIYGKTKRYYQNIRNKRLYLIDKEGKKVKQNQILGHILQGMESKILDVCMGIELGKLRVLIHDGFVTEGRIDEKQYSNVVKNELGISVRFDKQKLDCCLNKVNFT
jgi:hypothetical protein